MKLTVAILAIASISQAFAADMADVVTLGTRPYYLVKKMPSSSLKDELGECRAD